MRKVYYTRMRPLILFLPLCIAAFANARYQQPVAPLRTSSLESHEGLTISARPWTDPAQYKEAFPKKPSPFAGGVLAIQVIFRNDSDESVRITLDSIRLSFQLSDENRQELPPLKANEVADAVLKPGGKDPSTTRSRLPIPVGIPSGNNDKKWTELQTAAQNAAVPTGVVASHNSVKGLLYFDLQGQFDLLNTAHLYVPGITVMKNNRALTFFEIDLSQPNGK